MVADSSSTLALVRGDSARAAAAIYTLLLLSAIPFCGAVLGAIALRRASAGARLLVWRSATIALLMLFVGRALPLNAFAWDVPRALAAPLVALGRVQVTAGAAAPAIPVAGAADDIGGSAYASTIVQLFVAVYLAGAMMVLISTMIGSLRMRRMLRRAVPVNAAEWQIDRVRAEVGIRRSVRVFFSRAVRMPMTWGFASPVVVLPHASAQWSAADRRIVLLHELAHVRAADWMFNLAARAMCALYWMHPGAWMLARVLRTECELARDDEVIASGVRRSDYAELLMTAAEALRRGAMEPAEALALAQRGGLRGRLVAVLDAGHDTRPIARGWAAAAAVLTIGMAAPMSAVQLAPTREVLTTLMSDARWDSRAYAVLGLARRADSVAVARSAAERDPSPRVRAWARYALGETKQLPIDLVPERIPDL